VIESANFTAIAVSGVVTLVGGVALAYFARRFDARGQAEAALIGIGPQIIVAQNVRIDALSRQVEDVYKREQDCQRQLSDANHKIAESERRIRLLEDRFPRFGDDWKSDRRNDEC
jgi:hypothetical protein